MGSNPTILTARRDSERFACPKGNSLHHGECGERDGLSSWGKNSCAAAAGRKTVVGFPLIPCQRIYGEWLPHEGLNQPTHAFVAQRMRAPGFYPVGRRFESCQGHGHVNVRCGEKNVLDIVPPVMYIVCNTSVISSVG